MSEADLIPFKKNDERTKRLGRKGGLNNKGTKSAKKSISAKIRWLKEKGLTDKSLERLKDILDDPRLSIMDMQLYLSKLTKECKGDPKLMTSLMTHMENLHKLQHGEKKQIDIRSVNINLNADEAMTEKFMGDLKEHFGDDEK